MVYLKSFTLMYIKSINIYNVGPIEKCNIKPKFDENGNPIPLVAIGSNGCGKTMLTSYITDFLMETGKLVYRNVVQTNGAYYRIIGPRNVQNQKNGAAVFIQAVDGNRNYEYVEKTGSFKTEDVIGDIFDFQYFNQIHGELGSSKENNYKNVFCDNNNRHEIENIFNSNVLISFPSDRTEIPYWLNKKAVGITQKPDEDILISSVRYDRELYNDILVSSSMEKNAAWLNMVLKDLPYDPSFFNGSFDEDTTKRLSQDLFYNISFPLKRTIEQIIALVLKCDHVFIQKTERIFSEGYQICCYKDKDDKNPKIISSLDQLSLGESTLLNLFLTILRYADQNSLDYSYNLADISGIIIIDEIDTHLDTDMQYDVLPKLIGAFPKIQFIITTHSPLFLLGLERYKKSAGKDYDLVELPEGENISVERFSEFEKAYNTLLDTKRYETEIKRIVNQSANLTKPMIYTEGKTDYQHLTKALQVLKTDSTFHFDYDIKFYKHNGKDDFIQGKSSLITCLKMLISMNYPYKSIFIFDRDADIPRDIFEQQKKGEDFYHKNNVFAFKIPVPSFRVKSLSETQNEDICIEHYYPDEILKKEYVDPKTNVSKRIFIGNEFDSLGKSETLNKLCLPSKECGKDSIHIISSDRSRKVIDLNSQDDKAPNYALSKEDFYKKIISNTLDPMVYDSFKQIFSIIEEILRY